MHALFRHKLGLENLLPPDHVISGWNIARGDELVLLTVAKQDQERARERNGGFACSPDTPYDAALWRLSDKGLRQSVELKSLELTHIVPQVLSGGRFLLVGGRCRQEDEFNAKVIGPGGEVQTVFKVGDAVQDVQIAQGDAVWVSYFDEGSLHNKGWNDGWDGLTEFDLEGRIKWQYAGGILDCYSLNVGKGEVFACYYTDFPVLKVSLKDKAESLWKNEFRRGCKALAVWGNKVLLAGGYSDEFAMASLVVLDSEKTRMLDEFSLGLPPGIRLFTVRGPLLHYVNEENWWTLDVRDLV